MRYVKITGKTCTSEKHEKTAKISTGQGKSYLVLSNPFRSFPLMGHGLGHGKSGKIQANILSIKAKKVPDFSRNQELFGGDYWTRTSDLLRVKMRRGRKERAILSFPPLLAQNHLLSAPLVPLFPACSSSSLGHGLGQADRMFSQADFRAGISWFSVSQTEGMSMAP